MKINNKKGSSSVRTVSALLLVLAVVCVSSTLFVNESEGDQGETFWKDGIQYEDIGEGKAKVIGHSDNNENTGPHDSELIIPSTVENGEGDLSVVSIGDFAFDGCKSLTSVSMNSVTSIGKCAFANCISLASVSMNSVETIGISAFLGCTSFTSITIPNSVTSIGDAAFQLCTSLTSITILNSVESIGLYAFDGCIKLTSISLPNSVTITENKAFYRCHPETVTITGQGDGTGNILDAFFTNDPWKMHRENSGIVTTLIIDTSDEIDISDVKIIEGNILKITSASTNVTGPEGKMFSGKKLLSDDDISGKEFTGTNDGTGTDMIWNERNTRILSLHADDPNYGDVVGSGIYECDSFVQISAIPYDGYKFVSWSDGITDAKRTIKITANRSLTAYFAEEDPTMCKVTVIIEGNGMVYGMGTVEKGKVITLNAVADNGHSFQGWSHTTYTGTTISLSVESNMVITATFSATDTGIGGASNSLIDTTTAIVIILIIVIVFGSIVVISLVRGRRSV